MSNFYFVLLLILITYLLISLIVYYVQERIIFKPEKLPQDFEYRYDQNFEELYFEVKPGVSINGLHFKVKNPKGLVLYFHGNSKSVKGWAKFAYDFTRHGFEVVMVDYRGYGKSTGKRTEKGINEDIQFVYDKLKEIYGEQNIILYGRSLGSGFAAKLASVNQPKMLILDAPYYSMVTMGKQFLPFLPMSFLLRFPIRTYLWLKQVKCPIKIIHGTKDRLIPFKTSVKLAEISPRQTRLFTIIGGGHKNLPTFEEYHQVLRAILLLGA